VNLTAITRDKEIAIKHIVDSLQLAPHIFDEDSLLDMGSGAGLPIIPLKIVKRETAMLSVDAVAKKIAFQRHVIRLLGLQKIHALHARIEDLPEKYAGKFSLITSRAFTRLDYFVSMAMPLLARGGRLIAMKGGNAEEEIEVCNDTLQRLGYSVTEMYYYDLPCNMGKRSLVMIAPVNLLRMGLQRLVCEKCLLKRFDAALLI
jgi:16S rRNA (guanine527-N7)-methyltransferase